MAKVYGVTLPIAGYAYVEVQADDEDEAKEMAFATVGVNDIQEWDAYERIAEGNVLYAPQNRVEVSIVDDDAE